MDPVAAPGTVLFGHVNNPVADDVYNCYQSGGTARVDQIGWICPDTCACECYIGIHIHTEADAGVSGYQNAACYATVSFGGTFLYEWNV
jgi:hypothetical protein